MTRHFVCHRRHPYRGVTIGVFLTLGAAGFVYSTPWAGAVVAMVVAVLGLPPRKGTPMMDLMDAKDYLRAAFATLQVAKRMEGHGRLSRRDALLLTYLRSIAYSQYALTAHTLGINFTRPEEPR